MNFGWILGDSSYGEAIALDGKTGFYLRLFSPGSIGFV